MVLSLFAYLLLYDNILICFIFDRTISDAATAERDKLKQDLSEANQRIALIIKEGDERQTSSDQKRENELS